MGVPELGTPSKNTNVDIQALRLAMRWLLDFTASKTPPIMSPVFLFWTSGMQLSSTYWQFDQYTTFQSLIAWPIIFFTDNSYANPLMTEQSPEKMVTYLPTEFLTSASIAKPYNKIRINHSMFIIYITLEIAALGLSWFVIITMLFSKLNVVEVSSYPIVDFATKLHPQNVPPGSTGVQGYLDEITGASSIKIRKRFMDTRFILRTDSGHAENEKWGNENKNTPRRLVFLSHEGPGVEKLRAGIACRWDLGTKVPKLCKASCWIRFLGRMHREVWTIIIHRRQTTYLGSKSILFVILFLPHAITATRVIKIFDQIVRFQTQPEIADPGLGCEKGNNLRQPLENKKPRRLPSKMTLHNYIL